MSHTPFDEVLLKAVGQHIHIGKNVPEKDRVLEREYQRHKAFVQIAKKLAHDWAPTPAPPENV